MIIYIGIIIFLALCSLCRSVRLKKIIFWTFGIFLVLFIGLRGLNVGNDTKTYAYYYDYVGKMSFGELSHSDVRFEYGYLVYSWIIYHISHSYVFFFLVTSIITVLPLLKFLDRYSRNPLISLCLLFGLRYMFMYMNILRQCIALSFLLISLRYMERYKDFKAIIFILLASLFHSTAIVFIFVLIFRHFRITSFRKKFIAFVGIIFFVFPQQLFSLVFILFPSYAHYETSVYFQGGNIANYLNFALQLFFLMLLHFVNKRKFFGNCNRYYRMNSILYRIMIIGVFILLVSCNASILDRISDYFMIFSVVFIPNVVYALKDSLTFDFIFKRDNKIVKRKYYYILSKEMVTYSLVTLCAIYMIITLLLRPEWNRVVPYNLFFN